MNAELCVDHKWLANSNVRTCGGCLARKNEELWNKLQEVVENLCPQHGPGSYGRHGCRYCGLLLEIQELLALPVNAVDKALAILDEEAGHV